LSEARRTRVTVSSVPVSQVRAIKEVPGVAAEGRRKATVTGPTGGLRLSPHLRLSSEAIATAFSAG
jgi:hypothetical protein